MELLERLTNGGYTETERSLKEQNSRLLENCNDYLETIEVQRIYIGLLEQELSQRTPRNVEVVRPRRQFEDMDLSAVDPDELNPIRERDF